jgi:autotransporter strand-loop-strand O-heptosyltransferase
MNVQKIIQVTPGVMQIPPTGWGAVEKIIWEYTKSLRSVGYDVEILYTDDVSNSDNQIVHVHMANLANILNERGIEYVFSLHDHHVEHFGKDSQCYKDNYDAIKNSKITFVHSPHLIEYFDNMSNIVYLQHGVNNEDYIFLDRSEMVRRSPGIVMMANNGLGGDSLYDRKGFLIGIDAANRLQLPITIICPSSNREFFEYHKVSYDKLQIIYDLNYEDSIKELSKHTLFLNPSIIEAGHPNLTVVESLSCGIPVVGTSYVDVPGLIRCSRDLEDVVLKIDECLFKYDGLVESIKQTRESLSWNIVVTKMLQYYKRVYEISEKSQLEWQYKNTKILRLPKQEKSGIQVDFKNGRTFVKTSLHSQGLSAVFRDNKTNSIIFETTIGKTPGNWAYMYTPVDRFVDWEVSVNFGTIPLHVERMDLKRKKVLVTGNPDISSLVEFSLKTGAFLTLRDFKNGYFCYDPDANSDDFYTVFNEQQIKDYFTICPRVVDKLLLKSGSAALGDTIAFIPYAQKWAASKGIVADVDCAWSDIFKSTEYPNLCFVGRDVSIENYSNIWRFEYLFDRPLQKGYSDQFGLEYKEIPAMIRKSGKDNPVNERYVCLGVQTTTQCKYWNRVGGWDKLCEMLESEGIKVVSLDKYEVFGIDGYWNSLPEKSDKKVGMEFSEVIRYIEHCDAFIGVSSGLGWLAYGLDKQVVMISGTTVKNNEFTINNHRVSPPDNVCNGCFNKPHLYNFDAGNWLWCPVYSGTDKRFECTTSISPEMVFEAVMAALGES